MEYNKIPQYHSNYNIFKKPIPKKETSNLVKLVGGITLTVLAVLPLSGCGEIYRIPSRRGHTHYRGCGHQRRQSTIIFSFPTQWRHTHYRGCGHGGRKSYQRGRNNRKTRQSRPARQQRQGRSGKGQRGGRRR